MWLVRNEQIDFSFDSIFMQMQSDDSKVSFQISKFGIWTKQLGIVQQITHRNANSVQCILIAVGKLAKTLQQKNNKSNTFAKLCTFLRNFCWIYSVQPRFKSNLKPINIIVIAHKVETNDPH